MFPFLNSGKAYINGYDVSVYMEELQQDMGVCLQVCLLILSFVSLVILFLRVNLNGDEISNFHFLILFSKTHFLI
jgi:hypothetical protein